MSALLFASIWFAVGFVPTLSVMLLVERRITVGSVGALLVFTLMGPFALLTLICSLIGEYKNIVIWDGTKKPIRAPTDPSL